MNTTLKSMLVAAAALTAVSSYAQDKATLDLLVKKGLITAEERAKTLDEASKARAASGLNKVFVKEDNTKRLTFGGRVQTQYESIAAETTNDSGVVSKAADVSQAFMRRLYLGLQADMGDGLSGEIVYNFADDTLDKAIWTADTAYGKFILGYQKVQWGLEENTSSSKLYTIERSAANRFWNESVSSSSLGRLGFGARHTGLHYSNRSVIDTAQTLDYGFSVANAIQGETAIASNDMAVFANIIYSYKISDTHRYSFGLNYGTARDTRNAGGTATGAGVNDATISGFNPYIRSQIDNLVVQAEYITTTNEAVTGSTPNAVERKPEGYNVIVAYKLTDQLEAVVRYSRLETDGHGAGFNGLYRDATTTSVYNEYDSVYAGLNYYFVDHNAKIGVGYEQANASELMSAMGGTIGTGKAKADIFRVQAQVLF